MLGYESDYKKPKQISLFDEINKADPFRIHEVISKK